MAIVKTEILTLTQFDVITGETITRELTAEEIAQRETENAEFLTAQTAQEAKAAARQSALAKLAELGLTEEEIAAL